MNNGLEMNPAAWKTINKSKRRMLCAGYVYCRLTFDKNKSGLQYRLKVAISNEICKSLSYRKDDLIQVQEYVGDRNIFMLRKNAHHDNYAITQLDEGSPCYLSFPIEKKNNLPVRKTVAIEFDIPENGTIILYTDKILPV